VELADLDQFTVPLVVYGAMFGATVAGQVLGIAVEAALLRSHALWIPLALSVVLEAVVGARYGSARVGHVLTSGERARVSMNYSLALAALSLPLAGWIAASGATREAILAGPSAHTVAVVLATCVSALLAVTVARWVLMTVFSPR